MEAYSKKRITILFLLLSMLTCPDQSVLAAPAQNQLPAGKTEKKLPSMDSFHKIQKPENFPDLPIFDGHTTFAGGFYQPAINGISICQMRYYAQEDAQAVIDFYKNAFSGNGWKILNAAGTHLTARHQDGHMCAVTATGSRLPKKKITIYFVL